MKLKMLLKELKSLNLPPGGFAVIFSGALAARGIREARDLDIIVTKKLWDRLAKKYLVTKSDKGLKILLGENIEVIGGRVEKEEKDFKEIEEFIKNADLIGGIKYIKLEDVKRVKQRLGRKRDLKDIKLIDEYLNQKRKVRRLGRDFFTRPTLTVAKELLGKYLVRKIRRKILSGKIVETEAYIGPKDRASHAYKGKVTSRNKAEYLVGGHVYIYLVYGMYWQLNITTYLKGKPECVLIRALEPEGGDLGHANGPGKLCRWLKLNKSFYGKDLTSSKLLWLEDRGEKIEREDIVSCPRIGIDYAGPYWAKKPWRFYLRENPFVSLKS